MKIILIAILSILLLTGCSKPEPIVPKKTVPEPTPAASVSMESYYQLNANYTALQIEYQLLEQNYKTLKEGCDQILELYSTTAVSGAGHLEQIQADAEEKGRRASIMDNAIASVNSRKDPVVTDNLTTTTEREIFYRGWDLWYSALHEALQK